MGDSFPVFRKTKEDQSVFLVPAVPKVTLIQYNQYAKVAYFGQHILLLFPQDLETERTSFELQLLHLLLM